MRGAAEGAGAPRPRHHPGITAIAFGALLVEMKDAAVDVIALDR